MATAHPPCTVRGGGLLAPGSASHTGSSFADTAQDLGGGGQAQPGRRDRHPAERGGCAQLVAADQQDTEAVLAPGDHVGHPQRLPQAALHVVVDLTGRPRGDRREVAGLAPRRAALLRAPSSPTAARGPAARRWRPRRTRAPTPGLLRDELPAGPDRSVPPARSVSAAASPGQAAPATRSARRAPSPAARERHTPARACPVALASSTVSPQPSASDGRHGQPGPAEQVALVLLGHPPGQGHDLFQAELAEPGQQGLARRARYRRCRRGGPASGAAGRAPLPPGGAVACAGRAW